MRRLNRDFSLLEKILLDVDFQLRSDYKISSKKRRFMSLIISTIVIMHVFLHIRNGTTNQARSFLCMTFLQCQYLISKTNLY